MSDVPPAAGLPTIGLPAAHHDGSELYVPQGVPVLGSTVPVRVLVSDPSVTGVHLRTVADGEPRWVSGAFTTDGSDAAGQRWWTGELPITGPVTRYRFLLERADAAGQPLEPVWLNQFGLIARDVPDYHDFRISTNDPGPDWALDDVVYQVFPDRFARSAGAPAVAEIAPDWAVPAQWDDPVIGTGPQTPLQFYGGDLDGVREHLDHLRALGVTLLYLTPVFPARSNHRYNASTFAEVDPLLGGDEALAALADAAHRQGIRVIGDITTNHTGDDHPWFRAARAVDASAEARGRYYLSDDGSYISWLGVASLPKLNFGSKALREDLYGSQDSMIGRWLRPPFELDGWRVDVANMTGRHAADDYTLDVARGIRQRIDTDRPESLLMAEHGHDYTADLVGDGWQATMNYAGFTRPVWSWLTGGTDIGGQFLGVPGGIPRRPAEAITGTMRDFDALVPWTVQQRNWNILDSHDTPRFVEIATDPAVAEVGIGLLFTMVGVPMIFAGAEIGMRGVNGEDARRPLPWDRRAEWDIARLSMFTELIALRRSVEALRRGGLRWLLAEGDVIAFLRETPRERILVVAARAAWDGAALPAALGSAAETLYGGTDLLDSYGALAVPAGGPGLGVWRLH
ncbi:alpha-amylase family glycosyl hydrolase [Nakamurella aerolata]|uniref:Glycoside hydrolase family 13 protein n=1 Tax=Nakamurella aerolata TaxID=1656892 RepID=A0A849A492_9ACTN|nr:alpha-amylase family glycosyl hydrolase [Nakamurella aerolata]NNG34877.1 glycoside hydrolase family 13 protein [Nakamurella aerolata]